MTHKDETFEAIFLAEFPAVLRAARLIVGDAELARDVAQDAFAKLFVHWRRVSAYDAPGAWVCRVAINDAISAAQRRERGRRAAAAYEHERVLGGPDAGDDRRDELVAALGCLSPQQRAAVVLFYLEDLPIAEVAVAMGTRASTAKVHLHRARLKLAELLREEVSDVAG
jgi:RNA polymerase sigma-70 factor (ECF subfamily)